MSGFSIDASEVHQLGVDLGRAASNVVPEVVKVLEKGALNIKEDLVGQASGSSNAGFRVMARSISYDKTGALAFEIGPDKTRRGGPLGNIYFFGTSRGGGSGDLDAPLQEEAPRLERHLSRLLGDVL